MYHPDQDVIQRFATFQKVVYFVNQIFEIQEK